jgi:hypothetical protein
MDALITVNGQAYPDPVDYKPDTEPLGVWERNANGDLVGDLVAYKTKLNLNWGMLTGQQLQTLLGAVAPFFVAVQYLDPRTNGFSTGEFYASARSATLALRDDSGVNWWKDVSFNLIER